MASNPKSAEAEQILQRYGCHFEAGEVIFEMGAAADRSYWVQEGRVRIFRRIAGAERALRVVGSDDLFGEDAFIQGAKRRATAISLTGTRALAFDENSLPELLQAAPELGVHLVKNLTQRAREAEDRIQIGMLRDSQSKVILALMREAQSNPETQQADSAILELSPLELSARVGLDVDAVKRTVQQLRDGEYVNISDELLEIPNMEALQELYSLLEAGEDIVGGDER